jgi:endoglycosylceramidase
MRKWLLVVVLFASCAPDEAPPPPAGPYAVRDGFVRDVDGRAVILRGVNLSGMHKNAPYFAFHTPDDFVRVREELGMNTLRFLIEWAAVEPARGAYDDAYLDDVRERMDWARDAGLLVVLDMHQDLFGEGFAGGNGAPRWTCDEERYAAYEPQELWFLGYLEENVVACFDNFWSSTDLQTSYANAYAHVAERLHDHEAIIGFEVMNEPWLGSYGIEDFEPRALQPFYELVVPTVREAAPHWLAFLEPSSMSNLGRGTQLTKMPFDDVVYAPHSYDNGAESGDPFEDANREQILTKLVKLADEARTLGAALWVGEYGGDSDNPGITPYMDAEYDAFSSVFAGSSYWDYSRGDGYGIENEDGSPKPVLWDVLVRPWPERIAGTPGAWSFDDVTASFTVSWSGATSAPSILRVPARAYPSGVVVDVTGGTAVVDGDTVTVTADDEGADVSVAITRAP